jgi:hypothetical protein
VLTIDRFNCCFRICKAFLSLFRLPPSYSYIFLLVLPSRSGGRSAIASSAVRSDDRELRLVVYTGTNADGRWWTTLTGLPPPASLGKILSLIK